jgi:hypothetical protein
MPQSVLRRMQIAGAYRDKPLSMPTQSDSPNEVEQTKAEIAGVTVTMNDPKDADHNILECYCEYDLDEFAPKKFRGKKLPLPYRVTIDKDTRYVLNVQRNWREDDEQCMAMSSRVSSGNIAGPPLWPSIGLGGGTGGVGDPAAGIGGETAEPPTPWPGMGEAVTPDINGDGDGCGAPPPGGMGAAPCGLGGATEPIPPSPCCWGCGGTGGTFAGALGGVGRSSRIFTGPAAGNNSPRALA